jgi:hypothetical protein
MSSCVLSSLFPFPGCDKTDILIVDPCSTEHSYYVYRPSPVPLSNGDSTLVQLCTETGVTAMGEEALQGVRLDKERVWEVRHSVTGKDSV